MPSTRSMEKTMLPFDQTGYFTSLVTDYLQGHEALHPFYRELPGDAAFGQQIALRRQEFDKDWRSELAGILLDQYPENELRVPVKTNIELLRSGNTFTVVTGHQLNVFTGPLYFLYKIAHTIRLCTHLKGVYPEHNFVPVYWMATEDHDFEEISFFQLRGKNLHWNRNAAGAVGRLDTTGLGEVYEKFASELGPGDHADALRNLFRATYLEHENLADATRYLADQLFGQHGLVIVDGDDRRLKARFAPYMKKDLLEQVCFEQVSQSASALSEAGYHVQVNPREVNYFYLEEGMRERLEYSDGIFRVVDSSLSFSKEEILRMLEETPERISPNVITRPLYQEIVLPNLAYVGGGGELAYWLQLKSFFEAMQVPFPLLCLRNSALIVPEKEADRARRLGVKLPDLFLERSRLINKKIREISDIDIDLTPLKQQLSDQFSFLYELAEQTDKSFLGAVKAQEVKQQNGLEKLEKRLLKAQKRKLQDHVRRLATLQERFFPNQGLQERQLNFSEHFLELGPELIPALLEQFDPYPEGFTILTY